MRHPAKDPRRFFFRSASSLIVQVWKNVLSSCCAWKQISSFSITKQPAIVNRETQQRNCLGKRKKEQNSLYFRSARGVKIIIINQSQCRDNVICRLRSFSLRNRRRRALNIRESMKLSLIMFSLQKQERSLTFQTRKVII